MKKIGMIGIVLAFILAPISPALADTTSYDTDGNGIDDFTVITSGTSVHFDTDNDGEEDVGELIIKCHKIISVMVGGGAGAGRHVIIRCDTGTEHTIHHYYVRDNNGDEDTSDAGEVIQQQPK